MTNLMNEGLILDEHLNFKEIIHNRRLYQVHIQGRIRCHLGVMIEVDKALEVNLYRYVRGFSYSYHAWLEHTNHGVLRYDNAHGEDELHYHIFDLATGVERMKEPVPRERFPTLDAFVRMALRRVQDAQR